MQKYEVLHIKEKTDRQTIKVALHDIHSLPCPAEAARIFLLVARNNHKNTYTLQKKYYNRSRSRTMYINHKLKQQIQHVKYLFEQ